MHLRITHILPAVVLTLGACNAAVDAGRTNGGFIEDLPEPVAAAAAPYQDLRHVRLLPEDGCYWYRHVGPVETTLLPLRTDEGRPICTRAQPRRTVGG
ncbi:MAG: hypothetical protein ACP5EN_09970 [Rhodovulum sp.]